MFAVRVLLTIEVVSCLVHIKFKPLNVIVAASWYSVVISVQKFASVFIILT